MMQELIVALVVAYAAWSVAARYTPVTVKRRVRGVAAHVIRGIGLRKAADWIGKEPQDADCSSGCGSCGGCGSAEGDSASKQSATKSAKLSAVTPEALRRTAHPGRR